MPVVITGTDFTGVTSVRFNAVSANYTVNSTTQITATAPASLTSGAITVTNASGTATSPANYTATYAPIITGFTPPTAPEKRMVTITGYNFSGTNITSRTVKLNGTSVLALSISSTTQITFPVPVGATSGPITVQTSQGVATSATDLVVAAGAPPANDNFANAIPLTGTSGTFTGTNASATKEPGEPDHGGNTGGASVWFQWTAPTSGNFIFNPSNSPTTNFGVLQGVYTGTAVNALTRVAGGSANTTFSRFSSATAFQATAGVTYYIAIDGFAGYMGDFRLTWAPLNAPTIASFTPTSGTIGQTILVSGSGFTPNAVVTIGGAAVSASRITVNSSSSLTIQQLPAASTTGAVTVTTIAGTGTSSGTFTVNPPPIPTLSSFTPTSGVVGSDVVISGTALVLGSDNPPKVWFNGTPATMVSTSGNISTSFHTAVPDGATSGPITVQTLGGTATSAETFTVASSPAPTIYSLSPSSGVVGSNVTISGSSLTGTFAVTFNGTAASFVVTSPNEIVATVPAGASSGYVTVVTPGGGATSPSTFVVVNPPVISSMSPSYGVVSSNVTISGSGFTNVNSVTFNGTNSTFFVFDPNTISATVPTGATTGPITVNTNQGAVSTVEPFVVITLSAPTITGFTPASGTATTPVKITGANFNTVQSVLFNGVASNRVTVVSSTQITAGVPFGATDGPITVITSDGAAVSAENFVVTPPTMPTITGFSPSAIGAGGSVAISGSGFSGVTDVRFNGVSATVFTVNSPSLISATAPSNVSAGSITVVTSVGSATSPTSYTTTLAPIISGVTPNTGPVNRVITVSGANFSGPNISGQIMKLNGVPIGAFSRSSSFVTFAVPAGATTGPITMETSQGSATSGFIFVVASGPAPANDAFATPQALTGTAGSVSGNTANATKESGEPDHANNPGGASVWFTWTAPTSGPYLFNPFNSSSSQFGITQAIYTGDSVDSLTLVAAGLTPTGSFTRYASAAAFNAVAGTTYRIALDGYNGLMADYKLSWNPLTAPTISSFNPTTAYAGQSLTILGSGFVPGATVSVGGVTVSPARLTFNSSTSITVSQVPFTSVTGPIVVTTLAGTAISSSNLTIVAPPPPTISSFSPTTGSINTSVVISGTALALGDTSPVVRFNGVPVTGSFTQNSTSLTVRVPTGATTGPITVETSRGIATSAANFVIAAPFISSFSPSGARTGLSVTIDGGNFTGASEVLFNGVSAAFTVASASQITATIPDAAMTGKITVVTPGGSAVSATDFVVIVPPVITAQPASQTAVIGDTVSFTVAATSNGPMEFWWRHNGQPLLSNPTNDHSTLVLTNVSLADAGVYDCQVANNAAVLTTIPAILNVIKAPAQVTLEGTVATYNGTPQSVGISTSPANLNVLVTYDGSPNPPMNAGTYAVVATVDDPRYAGATTGTFTINRAPASIALDRLEGTFDGSPQGVSYTVSPAGLPVSLRYDGSTVPPTNAGVYAVVATVTDPNYNGTATATFTIRPKPVLVLLNNLAQRYDGTPKTVSAFLDPAGVPLAITYNGSPTPPTLPGSYAVVADVKDSNYTGHASATLVVTTTALVRHAPEIEGGLDGSLQVLQGEALTIGSGAWIANDLLVPGSPSIQVHADATFGGTVDAAGEITPSGYSVTLDKNSVLRHVVRRVDPLPLPVVNAPSPAVGTRDVVLNSPTEEAGDFATIRDLTVSGKGTLLVPYGTYRHLTANGDVTLVFGTPGFNEPAFYDLESLTVNGNARLQIAGPVMLIAANRIVLNGDLGDPLHPDWTTIRLAAGELLLKNNATLSASVVAPNGTVTIQSGLLRGSVVADQLNITSQGAIEDSQP